MEYKIKVRLKTNTDGYWEVLTKWWDGTKEELTEKLNKHFASVNGGKIEWEYLDNE